MLNLLTAPAHRHNAALEVFVRRDKKNGDVILSRRPDDWHGLFSALEGLVVPEDFLSDRKNIGKPEIRDPLDGLDTG